MYRNKKTERGQALILVVLAIVGLAGMVGLVVDGGNALLDRRKAQNAADSAALAAALSRTQIGQNPQATALASAAQNGYNNNGSSNVVQFYNPPASGPIIDGMVHVKPKTAM